ncbi:uncharacterized protein B0H64DRAFT_181533 [Chaetomium fimeti]|uniref:Uncharacterized protein n=1 Tax=Chaetomium fimeti TaxID=1854472 RepID=A0AAE0HD03_9PEZI|nr:hypothetical protein B0H64DRAFT_181533 [Chaetomium fimeti]
MAYTNRERTILGPLTTVFTPPAPCTIAIGLCETCDVAWWGQTCAETTVEDNTECWPTTTEGAPEPTKLPLFGRGFYSPGLECPAGYTSACSAVEGVTSQWKVQFQMEPEETFVGCCPEGFRCDNLNGQTCLMRATSATLPTVSCEDGASNNFGFTTIPNARVPAMNLYAPMIQLAWKASDRPETSTTSTGTTSGPTTSAPSSTATNDTNPPATDEPALSTAAIVGIAVGAAALLVLILTAAIFVCRRRRRQAGGGSPSDAHALPYAALRTGSPGAEEYSKHYYTGGVVEIGQGPQRVEMGQGREWVEMGPGREWVEAPAGEASPAEAPTEGHTRVEMFAENARVQQQPQQQPPMPGPGNVPPPPGYFQGQPAVEMPVRRYD